MIVAPTWCQVSGPAPHQVFKPSTSTPQFITIVSQCFNDHYVARFVSRYNWSLENHRIRHQFGCDNVLNSMIGDGSHCNGMFCYLAEKENLLDSVGGKCNGHFMLLTWKRFDIGVGWTRSSGTNSRRGLAAVNALTFEVKSRSDTATERARSVESFPKMRIAKNLLPILIIHVTQKGLVHCTIEVGFTNHGPPALWCKIPPHRILTEVKQT